MEIEFESVKAIINSTVVSASQLEAIKIEIPVSKKLERLLRANIIKRLDAHMQEEVKKGISFNTDTQGGYCSPCGKWFFYPTGGAEKCPDCGGQ